jgi:hypothetical protein
MSDRYLFYRVPEFLQAYLDYKPRPQNLPLLPYEREATIYFPEARVFAASRGNHYVISNLAKGGVVKIFQRHNGSLITNDCGMLGKLKDGRVITSQWVDPAYECKADEDSWSVSGQLNAVPSNKLFTPFKNLVFRLALVAFGWSSWFSHRLKGGIRKSLVLGRRPVPVHFRRTFRWSNDAIDIVDEIHIQAEVELSSLSIGDEFFVRYVPQSRFFQMQELQTKARSLTSEEIERLNRKERVEIRQTISAERMLAAGGMQ